MKALGGNATYTEYPGGHMASVWNPAYDGSRGDDIYPWMLNFIGQQPANIAPVVNAGADQSLSLPLPQVQLTGTASDADGTIAARTWTKISGPTVTMMDANTLTLTLTNILSGSYVFQLSVNDNDGATSADQVTLSVSAGSSVSREFDVNITWATNKQGGTWNDFVTTNGGIVGNSTALFDNHNVASTISLSIIAPFQNGTNNHGFTPGLYPNNVMQYYLRSTQAKVGALKLSGLSVSKVYDLSILSSNVDVWYPSDTRLTVAGQSVTINAKGNANQLANFLSLTPNTNGEITITVAPATTASTNVGVINAVVIKERLPVGNNVPPVVNAGPDRQVSLPLSQLQLPGTATDTNGTIISLLWTKISGPAVTMANATMTTLTLTNLLAGTYVFQLRAQDNGGAAAIDPVTVIVHPASVVTAREFDINITWEWNKQASLPWNDFITTHGGVVGNSAVLFDKNGVTSTISLSVTAPFQDGADNHGVIPGLYPNNVMTYYLRSTQVKIGSLKLAGLNATKKYDLSILSSNVDVWYSSDTRLTVQGQVATVNARGNASQLVNFTNISPTGIGEIPITVAPATTNSTNVGVITAMILIEHNAGSPDARTTTQEVVMADPEKPSSPPGDYINAFPNPVEDHLDVEISSSSRTPETFSIEFTDIRGVQVYARQVGGRDGTNTISERIVADFMQSGLYIMAVRSSQNGVKYFKILKK